MKHLKKLSLTLALLITAATGAWAEDWTSGDCTVTLSNGVMTVSGNGAMADYTGVTVLPWKDSRSNITGIVVEEGVTSIAKYAFAGCTNVASVSLPSSLTSIGERAFFNCTNAGFTSIIIPVNVETIGDRAFQSCSKLTKVNIPDKVTSIGVNAFYGCTSVTSVTIGRSVTSIGEQAFRNCSAMTTLTVKAPSCTLGDNALDLCNNLATISVPSDRVDYYKSAAGWSAYASKIQEIPAGTVFFSDDQIEADFDMPANDVTATYTIKRDMSVDMAVTVQDAEQNSRFRVQNQGNSFVPVGLTNEQVMALFNVHDDIESKDLTAITDYTVQIFAADDNDQPTGTAMTFSNFTYAPGRYIVKAVAASNSNYNGETALSNVFTLFQGYEVTVPAGEYVTYYKDEALYVEDTDAKLYTITAVNGDKATATELTVAAASTPQLVKNNAETEKTILLIPTTERTPDDVEVYDGFKGTLTDTQIDASTTTQNNYAFNGKEFVWVKNDIAIAANKAWLEVNTPSNARSVSIVFGDSDTTGIDSIERTEKADGDWYDLNGRKLQAAPKRKGVYIHNGRKEVVK